MFVINNDDDDLTFYISIFDTRFDIIIFDTRFDIIIFDTRFDISIFDTRFDIIIFDTRFDISIFDTRFDISIFDTRFDIIIFDTRFDISIFDTRFDISIFDTRFDISIFDTRYHRNTDGEESTITARVNNFDDFSQTRVGSQLTPILVNISNFASCFSTNQFLRYLSEFKEIGNLVRKCESTWNKLHQNLRLLKSTRVPLPMKPHLHSINHESSPSLLLNEN